jgi:hypothetical protein
MPGKPEQFGRQRSFWASVAAAIAALVRRSGCSIDHSPLPEIREVGREWRSTA